MTAWLGAIADDVTGACDLADALCEQGDSALVHFGVPDSNTRMPPADCAVVALKSRTAPTAAAVAESVAAARALLDAGCTTLYQKYCSTFDSTDTGNIGPVADALRRLRSDTLPALGIGTPATPRAGRTVYQGHLFVGDRLLAESPMRDHPLTPMRDSDLVALLSRQTRDPVALVPWSVVARGADDVVADVATARAAGAGHVLLDALDDDHLDSAATALHRLNSEGEPLLIGGAAGLAGALGRTRLGSRAGRSARAVPDLTGGRRLILSGSCSARTREQVAAFDGPRIELSPIDLAADPEGTVDRVLTEVEHAFESSTDAVLVSSSADPAVVRDTAGRLGPDRAAALLESATGRIAAEAVGALGVRRLLVAGGETSGAVVHALGVRAMRVGPAVGPGLPWMIPADGAPVAVLLKSSNFGARDLFRAAWQACP